MVLLSKCVHFLGDCSSSPSPPDLTLFQFNTVFQKEVQYHWCHKYSAFDCTTGAMHSGKSQPGGWSLPFFPPLFLCATVPEQDGGSLPYDVASVNFISTAHSKQRLFLFLNELKGLPFHSWEGGDKGNRSGMDKLLFVWKTKCTAPEASLRTADRKFEYHFGCTHEI